RFDGYSGQSFEVEPEVESRNTGRIDRTKIIRPPEFPVTLNYLMRGSGDTWKIVDVYLAGTVSELATQRSEFSAILKKGGAAALTFSQTSSFAWSGIAALQLPRMRRQSASSQS